MQTENLSGVYVTGQGPAIVMLHSSLSSANQWQGLTNQLKDNFTIINFDLLGYGQAPKVKEEKTYGFETEINRINSVLDDVIPNQPFHLVGHSCGVYAGATHLCLPGLGVTAV